MTSCYQKKKPSALHRREMVKILIDQNREKLEMPGKKNLDTIAYKIASKYSDSFQDTFQGDAFGHQSLFDQLLFCYKYVMRQHKDLAKTRRTSPRKKRPVASKDSPIASELNEQAKNWMKDHHKMSNHDWPVVCCHMQKTYFMQSSMIER